MEAVIALIIQYAAMWAPALVAVLGTITTVILAINKCRDAINEWKSDDTMRDIKANLAKVSQENEELVRCNKLLLDEITKIKDYADHKKREG